MNRIILVVAILLIIFALVLGGLWYFQNTNISTPKTPIDELTKINDDTGNGNVSVAVTLITKENAGSKGASEYDLDKKYVFSVVMNTHSVDISKVDLVKNSTLSIGTTKLKPQWNQTMESLGHHRNGFLVFDKKINANKLKLIITDIAKVDERTFSWSL